MEKLSKIKRNPSIKNQNETNRRKMVTVFSKYYITILKKKREKKKRGKIAKYRQNTKNS